MFSSGVPSPAGDFPDQARERPGDIAQDAPYALVAFDLPMDRAYHYRVPEPISKAILPGVRVKAELGKRILVGVCVERCDDSPVAENRLKDIIAVVDPETALSETLLNLGRWMAEYYCCSWGEALGAMFSGEQPTRSKARRVFHVKPACPLDELDAHIEALEANADRLDARATPRAGPREDGGREHPDRKRAKILRIVRDSEQDFTMARIIQLTGYTASPIKTLARGGWLAFVDAEPEKPRAPADTPRNFQPVQLTPDQAAAVDSIREARRKEKFGVTLLLGVTGSGKTEVYLRLIGDVLKEGKSAMVLVPEISLTPQATRVFSERFNDIAVLHSRMTARQRRRARARLRNGEARIVIGPRSALFAPVSDLGLIVVDEEHEPSFKQQQTPRYHARDVAVMRAKMGGCHVVLGSASPSLESMNNAITGKYHIARLNSRAGQAPMPKVIVMDMDRDERERGPRHRAGRGCLSRLLEELLKATVQRREQAILFLNRRGYHTALWCAFCKETVRCKSCDVPLTLHKRRGRVLCHLCADSHPRPRACPACNRASLGELGLGTERVEETVAALVPGARVLRMDSDSMRGPGAHEEALEKFRDGEADVLVGTQMVAKGLDFPNVTLVGVISADLGLSMPDFRAGERTFQLVLQVAGRTSRAEKPGVVVVQTRMPQQAEIQYASAHDYNSFAEAELRNRRETWFPPSCRLVRVELNGKNRERVKTEAETLAGELRRDFANDADVRVAGPAPAPIEYIRDRFRFHLLVKTAGYSAQRRAVEWLRTARETRRRGVQLVVDVDPTQLM